MPLEDVIANLERRIAALEARPALRYVGVWKGGGEYHEGNFTTHAGSIWAARRTTTAKPGTDDSWTLACKRGRDRDARDDAGGATMETLDEAMRRAERMLNEQCDEQLFDQCAAVARKGGTASDVERTRAIYAERFSPERRRMALAGIRRNIIRRREIANSGGV